LEKNTEKNLAAQEIINDFNKIISPEENVF